MGSDRPRLGTSRARALGREGRGLTRASCAGLWRCPGGVWPWELLGTLIVAPGEPDCPSIHRPFMGVRGFL